MVLASDALVRDGELIGDPAEGALVVPAAKGGIDAVSTRERYPRIAELPFDAACKLMATFHTMTGTSGKQVIRCFVKGAPDQLLARAATVVAADDGPAPADGAFRQRYLAGNQRLGEQGLRVIATAREDFDPAAPDPGPDLLPLVTGLELLALAGIIDPPRPAAKAPIATAAKAGVRVRMITGDHAVTAAAVAGQLGIDGTVLTDADFGAMSDQEALTRIEDVGRARSWRSVMILTDDSFSTIVKAVELGRGLYDNLARYIRFQIGGLSGYIAAFLGASIFDVAEGIPLLPLQTLWVSFTMLSIQPAGLGYSKPAAGLMDRPPLPPGRPILTRALIVWLAFVGLLMAIGTLSVISWADQAHGLGIAQTMDMVTFALFILFFSIQSKDDQDSAFSPGTFSDKTFVMTTSGSFLLLVLPTVLGIFQTVLKTVRLDVRQWLICTTVALSVVAAAEIRKAVLRQTAARAIHPADAPGPGPRPAERPSGAWNGSGRADVTDGGGRRPRL
jgi:P-type Ca2+ transporter type 2C